MTRLLPTPVVFACALAGSLTAAAQEPASGGSTDLAPIAVTGSRIRGVMIDGAWPLTTIERDELLDSGHQRLGDFLQELPFTSGSPLNTQTSRRGQGGGLSRGIETVELRGLGPERTLVLLNGRRFVPGGNGASGVVDVGMLPIAMVDRIEIFKAGASVEYGADALAGVINVITREPFDGVELSASAKAAARGDGETGSVTALAGRTFARGGFLGGFSWTDQSPVSKGDRRFSRTRLSLSGPGNEVVFDGSSAPPSGQYRTSFGPLTLIDGRLGTGLDDFRPFVEAGPDTDRYNFNPFEDLLQASERFSLFGQGEWLVGDVNVFAEALYHRRDSSQQLAPLPFFTTREQGVVVDAGNVYNPFRETLTDVRRRLVEAGPRTFSQDNEAWRGVVGADGRIGGWFWDLSLAHGRNETDQVKTGDLLDDRLAAALGPSFRDADGVPRCGAPGGVVAGCVPLNVFGGPGSITPEMLAYVGTTLRDSGFNEQTVFDANLAGDLLDLPAGPLAMAAGIEWREERALDRPDPESQAGNTTGNARALTRGSFESREAYLEFAVPLAADRPWARSLDLDLGARLVDFSNFGSDSVFEIGAGWRPTDTLSLRGAWSQAFRAPNVGELF
ncbi:MAG: TonB-dependent receptor, partial [Wenzhouxiangellaceae bacterium]|nr:TonB-dependent receptor [Wenzhouxiangellaceae bacterium]